MTTDSATPPKPRRFGEVKGPLLVWMVFTAYFAVAVPLGGSPTNALPQQVTAMLILRLVASIGIGWGPLLVFLVVFVWRRERRLSLRETFAALGFKKQGAGRSLFWCAVLLPAFAAVYLASSAVMLLVGPPSGSQTLVPAGGLPRWYLFYLVVQSLFPVAVVEEAWGRGYALDRLVPQHPIHVRPAMPAILLGALLVTTTHLPAYLLLYPLVYRFSTAQALVLLATNVFPFSVLIGVAYIRARTRNVVGPVFLHFLLDSGLYILLLITS